MRLTGLFEELVATAVDGNYNLHLIAFGVVDSENEHSLKWLMRQLKVVIDDDHHLAFISDKHGAIAKTLENMYPTGSIHGIYIYHLLNNLVTYSMERTCSIGFKGVKGFGDKTLKIERH